MNFIGETVVHIGYTDEEREKWGWGDGAKAGRVETVTLEPGEELIGCEIHHDGYNTYGVTWLTWRF